MNSAQVTAFQFGICLKNIVRNDSKSCVLPPMSINPCHGIQIISTRDKPSFHPLLKCRRPLRVCSAGGKGMMENNDENSPWKSISNAMEKFKGQSIEDVLRKQIQKGEYFDNGGSGVRPPGGGDSGGGGGSPDGTAGPEDESFLENDTLQLIFAIGALIFLYIYLLMGNELLRIILDCLWFLVGGGQSSRIQSIMIKLGRFYEDSKETENIDDEDWLEKTILNTPTWYYDPKDFRRAVKNYYASDADE